MYSWAISSVTQRVSTNKSNNNGHSGEKFTVTIKAALSCRRWSMLKLVFACQCSNRWVSFISSIPSLPLIRFYRIRSMHIHFMLMVLLQLNRTFWKFVIRLIVQTICSTPVAFRNAFEWLSMVTTTTTTDKCDIHCVHEEYFCYSMNQPGNARPSHFSL